MQEMEPTPVFLPGKFHRQRSLVGYSCGSQRVGHDWGFHIASEHVIFQDPKYDLKIIDFLLHTVYTAIKKENYQMTHFELGKHTFYL